MAFRLKSLTFLSLLLLLSTPVIAQQNDAFSVEEDISVVTLAALDKITTQLSTIEILQDQTVRFGTLDITLRYCRTNPPEEAPESVAFLEITDIGQNNQDVKVFSGWMFASSPALSPLEHPVYDVWVKDCKITSGPELTSKE
ncbi:MAG: DUF2155 domain-containing protein [Emcibacter sp.]|nr:DUF2155 domain-containing protein [Emcibacter sp.]